MVKKYTAPISSILCREGETARYLCDLYNAILSLIQRSLGDGGTTPTNVAGKTILARLADITSSLYNLVTTFGSVAYFTATSSSSPLTFTQDVSSTSIGKGLIELFIQSDRACTVNLYCSFDNTRYWLFDSITITASGSYSFVYKGACRWVKVEIPESGTYTVQLGFVNA